MKKVGNPFKCRNCEKPEITLEGLYYHIKYYHNNKQHFELNMPVKSISKESFRTLKTSGRSYRKKNIKITMQKHQIQQCN